MARKTASRMDLRREAEAAEAAGSTGTKKKKAKKKATRKKATRKSAKAAVRRQLIWGVFSGSLKEEARFPYDQRKAAEEKLEALRNRSTKKMYFIQPIKEPLGDAPVPAEDETPDEEDIAEEILDESEADLTGDEVDAVDEDDLDLDVDDVGDMDGVMEIDDEGEPVEPSDDEEAK